MRPVGSVVSGAAADNTNELLVANIPKPEALALIFAMTFNMPCIVALAATYQETHSVKWTARIALYYTGVGSRTQKSRIQTGNKGKCGFKRFLV